MASRIKDKKTRTKVFLALANLDDFVEVKNIAIWINERWRAPQSVAEKYVGNVLSIMRVEDESRHAYKLLETAEGRSPYRYKLGKFTVKTTASADMLIMLNNTYHKKGRIISPADEQQIKEEISRKYSIPIATLEERLAKAIKGKYLIRGKEDGLLKTGDRLGLEHDFLEALLNFNPGVSAGGPTRPVKPKSNPASPKNSPRLTKKKNQQNSKGKK